MCTVATHTRIFGYSIARRAYAVEEFSDDMLQAIADSEMDKRHEHLNILLEG